MKKYLYFLFMAIFATMSFTLTSCSDDDDEPNGDNTKSSFTVNGVAYDIHTTTGANSTFTTTPTNGSMIDFELYPKKSDELDIYPRCSANISVETLKPLEKGAILSITSPSVEFHTDLMEYTSYTEVKSGNITVESVSNNAVSFKFNNLKLTNDDNETITLNGIITCEYIEL